MKKQILLPTKVFTELHREFGVHRVVLNRALKYEHSSKRDKMLREAAPVGYIPDVETGFDHAVGVMHQTFCSRVRLSVNLKDNIATIYVDDKQVAKFNDITIGTWGNALYSLQQMLNQLNS